VSIAPVVRTVDVKASPPRAFELFTSRMGRWWPVGKTPGRNPHDDVVVEPFAGGRWFERDAEGVETQWGQVLAWEPPGRLLLGWQLNSHWTYDPDLLTEVDITFTPLDRGGTRVRLEHRQLERFGSDAERVADAVGSGWPARLGEFVAYVDTQPA
jgi:uncharacterized protein YndB with AHSA1/START domain